MIDNEGKAGYKVNQHLGDIGFLVALSILDNPSYWLQDVLRGLERSVITHMMTMCNDNQSEASRRLGVSRTALIYKLKSYKD